MFKRIICLFFILFTLVSSIYSKDKQLTLWSPDKGISVNINIENGIQYSIDVDQKTIIKRCKAQLLSSIHNDNLELKNWLQKRYGCRFFDSCLPVGFKATEGFLIPAIFSI